MADPLATRIESTVDGIIETALPSAQAITFGETEAAEADYIFTRATRAVEDPPGSGIFLYDCTVIAHGNFTAANLLTLETLFDSATTLGDAIRTAGSGSVVIPLGQPVEINAGNKSGQNLDLEHQYNFGLWAQTQEVSDAA